MSMEWSSEDKEKTPHNDQQTCLTDSSSSSMEEMPLFPATPPSYDWPWAGDSIRDAYVPLDNQQNGEWAFDDCMRIGSQAVGSRIVPYPANLEVRLLMIYFWSGKSHLNRRRILFETSPTSRFSPTLSERSLAIHVLTRYRT